MGRAEMNFGPPLSVFVSIHRIVPAVCPSAFRNCCPNGLRCPPQRCVARENTCVSRHLLLWCHILCLCRKVFQQIDKFCRSDRGCEPFRHAALVLNSTFFDIGFGKPFRGAIHLLVEFVNGDHILVYVKLGAIFLGRSSDKLGSWFGVRARARAEGSIAVLEPWGTPAVALQL